MYDVDIRDELRSAVRREHAADGDTAIIEELGILQGQVRIDLAAVNGSLKGYEIKSAADTLRRLPMQVTCYARVLDYAELVLADEHRDDALALIPRWWGVTIATRGRDGSVQLQRERVAERNERLDARALAELLWHAETMAMLRDRGAHRGLSRAPRSDAWDRLVSTCSLEEIAAAVRARLKARAVQRAEPPPR